MNNLCNLLNRNKVKLSEKELELNFHGDYKGKDLDTSFAGGYELTLPSGKFLMGNTKLAYNVLHKTM